MRYDFEKVKGIYYPIYIGQSDCGSGPRIGGAAPFNVKPKFVGQLTRYLLTMPLPDDSEISIYHSFNFFEDGPDGFHDAAYQLHDENSHLIEVVRHPLSRRGEDSSIPSDVSGCCLVISGSAEKEKRSGYEFHKTGGVPVFQNEFDSEIRALAEKLLDQGFKHFLQLAFPAGPNDALLDCTWPFGDAIFHLFVRMTDAKFEYRFCWG